MTSHPFLLFQCRTMNVSRPLPCDRRRLQYFADRSRPSDKSQAKFRTMTWTGSHSCASLTAPPLEPCYFKTPPHELVSRNHSYLHRRIGRVSTGTVVHKWLQRLVTPSLFSSVKQYCSTREAKAAEGSNSNKNRRNEPPDSVTWTLGTCLRTSWRHIGHNNIKQIRD